MAAAAVKETPKELTGTQRAAVLLMFLNRDVSGVILEHLKADEIRDIGLAMADMDDVPSEVVERVVADFVRDLHRTTLFPRTGRAFALGVLPSLVPEDRRTRVEAALKRNLSRDFEEYIATRAPEAVAAILSDEHPQTRAVALMLMGTDNAASVLKCMDEEERLDSTLRMARLRTVPGELADDVERALRVALEDDGADRWVVEGIDRTAQVLGRLGSEINEEVLDRLEDDDDELADILRKRMVVFDDLQDLDRRGVQAILKEIEKQDLLLALKGASPEMRDLFLGNLSSRAAADLEEELEIMGPTPKKALREAQENIVEVAMRLAEEGTIYLAALGEED
ncbi:MAG: FliG C-terminal domain-containing protein [Myxococcota bacterium]|nr:FliG C-terminal domain-containing protein [Myxococcota bacterium]